MRQFCRATPWVAPVLVYALPAALSILLFTGNASPQGSDDDFQVARNLYRDTGDYATAAGLFAEFIRNYPLSPQLADARLMLARSYARSERCPQAVGAYQDFYLEHPDHIGSLEARRERADCLQQEGEHLRAAAAFEEVQHLYSASDFAPQALLEAARSYTAAQSLAEATRVYRRLLKDYSSHPQTQSGRYRLAQLRFAAGDGEGTQRLLTEISTRAPASDLARDALLLSGRLLLFLERPDEARESFDRLDVAFPGSEHADSARVDLAMYLYDRGFFGRAADAFRRARDRIEDPRLRSKASLGLADALRQGGDYEAARQDYQSLLVGDVDPAADGFNAARLGLAVTYGHTDRYSEAVNLFLDLIHPSFPSARNSGQLDLPAGAGESLETVSAAAITSQSVVARRELAALYRRRGDLSRAATWFRSYLDLVAAIGVGEFPEPVQQQQRVRLDLAQVYDSAGYHQEAVELFQSLASVSGPLSADARFGLAGAYEHAGAYRLALREYGSFLERFPGHLHIGKATDRVEHLKEFTVLDPRGRNRELHQAIIDMLSGHSTRSVRFDLAQSLRRHGDYENAVALLETYVAAYRDDPATPEAQLHLAQSLGKLARQRQLEGLTEEADSLRRLSEQEFRILADAEAGPWSRRAQLRLVTAEAELAATDSSQLRILVAGLTGFLDLHGESGELEMDIGARALLQLGNARRQQAETTAARLAESAPGQRSGADSRGVSERPSAGQLTGADTEHTPESDRRVWSASEQLALAATAYRKLQRKYPKSPLVPQARFGLALCRASEDVTAATDSLNALLRDIPGSSLIPTVLFELGHALLKQEKRRAGVARFQELLMAYPAFPRRRDVQKQLARAHFELGEYGRAIELYRFLADSDPEADSDGALRRQLAQSLHRNGQFDQALDLYSRLLTARPQSATADSMHLARARLLAQVGRSTDAVEELGRLDASPLSPVAGRLAGDILFEGGRFGDAVQMYSPLIESPESGRTVHARRALALFRLDRLKDARRAADKFSKRFGDDSPWPLVFRLEEGRFRLRHREFDRALKLFREIEKDAPEIPMSLAEFEETDATLRHMASAPAVAAAYFAATALWEQNRINPAEELAGAALAAQLDFVDRFPGSPHAAEVHLRLGHYHYDVLDLHLQAARYFRAALEGSGALEQRRGAIWMLLRCYEKTYEYDEAHRTALRLLREYPDHPRANDVQLKIGSILLEKGQNTEAIAYLEQVLEWAEGDEAAEARFSIGQAFQSMAQYRKAIESYYKVSYHGADSSAMWVTSADYRRAQCYEQLTEYGQAAKVYQRIVQREGSDSAFGRGALERLNLLPN